jgi:hypothetical protein
MKDVKLLTDTDRIDLLAERHWIVGFAPSGDWCVFVNPDASDNTHGGGMIYGDTIREAIDNAYQSDGTGVIVSKEQA